MLRRIYRSIPSASVTRWLPQTQMTTAATSGMSTDAGDAAPSTSDGGEATIRRTLSARFPDAVHIHVEDTSGGCGSFFAVSVVDAEFDGMRRVKQNQVVSKALKAAISEMHGIKIQTATPAEYREYVDAK